MSEYTREQIEHNRQVWFDALRSGMYKKHNNKLFSSANDKKCCVLGVGMKTLGAQFNDVFHMLGMSPNKVTFRRPLKNLRPKTNIPKGGPINYLVDLNDDICYTLAQMADILEKQFSRGNVNER